MAMLNAIPLEALLLSIKQSRYNASRSLTYLGTVKTLIEQLELQIAQASSELNADESSVSETVTLADRRSLRIIKAQCELHKLALNKRIAQIERANEFKATKNRQEKASLRLASLLTDTGMLPQFHAAIKAKNAEIAEAQIERVKHEAVTRPLLRDLTEQKELALASERQAKELTTLLDQYDKDKQTINSTETISSDNNVTELDTDNPFGKPEDWL